MTEVYNIAELFARDPREHTAEDRKRIIAELRLAREKFIQNPSAPAARAKPKEIAHLNVDIKL